MANPEVDRAINDGLGALRRGDHAGALERFERAFAGDPGNAAAQSLCGVALMGLGRLEESKKELIEAVAKQPQAAPLRFYLAEYYLRVQDLLAAQRELEAAVARQTNFSLAWERLGDVHISSGRPGDGARAYDEALALDSANLPLALKFARALRAAKRYDVALEVLDHAEKLRPRDKSVAIARAEILVARGDLDGFDKSAAELLASGPDDPAAWRGLAAAAADVGRFRLASRALEKALPDGARSPRELVDYAKICMQALQFEKADEALAEAAAAVCNNPAVLAAKALLLTYQGRLGEAEDYCRQCLAVDPHNIEAYPQLSAIRNGRLTDDEEAPLRALSRREDQSAAARSMASFVLGHSYDARGKFDEAFAEYARANKLAMERNLNEGLAFDLRGADAWIGRLIERFKGAPSASDSSTRTSPLFIVGLPRCGSTLIESVLAAHSAVAPGGELPMLPPLFIRWMKSQGPDGSGVLADIDRRRLAEAYFSEAPPASGERFFTDKNLLNFEAVGLIAQLFPDSKIINVRRSPLESGMAIYRQDLPKFWTYATSFDNIARRYIQYARLTKHWELYYGDRFVTIQYEDFASDFDRQARTLVAVCGLEWEDACASFHEHVRVAATISAAQVREPVKERAGRAVDYEKRLGGYRAAIAAAGIDLDTGALRA